MRVPGFHGANDQEACLDWLDIRFGRSTRTWTNNLTFQWDWEKWRVNSKESVSLTRYPKRGLNDILTASNGGAISSTADWEKKAGEIRQSVVWMMGDEPPVMPPGAGRAAGRGGARGGAARGGPGGRPGGNPGQVTPDLPAWVIQRGGNPFGWLPPQRT